MVLFTESQDFFLLPKISNFKTIISDFDTSERIFVLSGQNAISDYHKNIT